MDTCTFTQKCNLRYFIHYWHFTSLNTTADWVSWFQRGCPLPFKISKISKTSLNFSYFSKSLLLYSLDIKMSPFTQSVSQFYSNSPLVLHAQSNSCLSLYLCSDSSCYNGKKRVFLIGYISYTNYCKKWHVWQPKKAAWENEEYTSLTI